MMTVKDERKRKKILRSNDYNELIIDSLVKTVEEIQTGTLAPEDISIEDLDPDALLEKLGIPPEGESDFEYAILLASNRVNGKKSPEKLSSMIRDPEMRAEFTDEDWDLLADFVEGKLGSKRGRRKLDAPFSAVRRKYASEYYAALLIRLEMKARRSRHEKIRGILPKLIDKISEEKGANPEKVAEILKKSRY